MGLVQLDASFHAHVNWIKLWESLAFFLGNGDPVGNGVRRGIEAVVLVPHGRDS